MQELLYKNRDKVIFLASHHPFSYGHMAAIFPGRTISSRSQLPVKPVHSLPVVGSLYPLLRKTFTNPEDLKHPEYKYDQAGGCRF